MFFSEQGLEQDLSERPAAFVPCVKAIVLLQSFEDLACGENGQALPKSKESAKNICGFLRPLQDHLSYQNDPVYYKLLL